MLEVLESLDQSVLSVFWITICAALAPLLSGLVPRRLVPEVVFLLGLGIVIGPQVLGLAGNSEAIQLVHEFGLGLLFLLAGYEIDARTVQGRGGKVAGLTWLGSFGLGILLVWLIGNLTPITAEIAVSIAVTSTALGTLLPILRDNGLLKTPVGGTVLMHGAFGEVGPIVAMTVLLSARGALGSLLVLFAFLAITMLVVIPVIRLRGGSSRLLRLVRAGAETSSQTAIRLVLLLTVSLSVLAVVFELDLVLGAFAAGFVLRQALPERDNRLEPKLDGLAFGFFIPFFFITSGMAIDPTAVLAQPGTLALLVAMMLVLRGGPVFLASRLLRHPGSGAPVFGVRQSVQIGLFGATGLPVIVAVTTIAVRNDEMSQASASLLVVAGALTVLLFPTLAIQLGRRSADRTREPPFLRS